VEEVLEEKEETVEREEGDQTEEGEEEEEEEVGVGKRGRAKTNWAAF
jgi:hypothetical protein